MTHTYCDCYFCGGAVQERPITREIWWQAQLFLIENVPVGVCVQCGEKFVAAEVARRIDQMLAGQTSPDQFVSVPKYQYRETEQTA